MTDRKTYHFVREGHVEVPCTRHGRLSYRWAPAWYLLNEKGQKMYPPMAWADVLRLCKRDNAKRKLNES